MQELINDFDTDGSGTISVFEFRDFCYRIPHLAWKVNQDKGVAHTTEHACPALSCPVLPCPVLPCPV